MPEGILGRADDMLIIRAANVYPSALDEIVKSVPIIAEYQVIIDRPNELDVLPSGSNPPVTSQRTRNGTWRSGSKTRRCSPSEAVRRSS